MVLGILPLAKTLGTLARHEVAGNERSRPAAQLLHAVTAAHVDPLSGDANGSRDQGAA